MRIISIVVAVCGGIASSSYAQVLVDPGFEDQPILCNIPDATGFWGVDMGTTVTTQQGVTPAEGERMLRFDQTGPCCAGGGGVGARGSDIAQLVLVAPVADLVAMGMARARASVAVNRVTGSSLVDTQFIVAMHALDGEPSTFPTGCTTGRAALKSGSASVFSDADPGTWERVSVSLDLPASTTFVAVYVSAVENISDGGAGNEFEGHFADGVRFSIVSQCPADFDRSGFVDLDDYVAFVLAFEAGTDDADFDQSGFVDLDDFIAFVQSFELGC
ncbi:MAG: hypothetical protein IT435_17320 [Phycisphaerales bacterium]|nr:hypothetical protein [Phycisphaerales bacterium]